MRTKTPSKGLHIIFRIKSEDFPTGVRTREYWNELGNGKRHNQINLMGNGYYVVERGPGYSQINGPELLVTLSKDNMQELLNVLEQFEEETNAIRKMATKLTRYYQPTNRDNLAFALSGYLHKNRVPKKLCDNLVEHLIDATGDEEKANRFQTIRDTFAKEADTDQVSGYTKFLEAVSGDESAILTVQKEFGILGYHLISNGDGRAKNSAKQKSEKEKKKKQRIEYIQKYSISETALAEAIIIWQKAFFAISDFGDRNEVKITLEKQIELDDDRKTVLKPLDLISYINKPYRFKSEDDFWAYIEKAKQETLDSLYKKTEVIWKKYVDANSFHISICSADTIFTHKQDRVGTTHYLFFIGDNDTGKSAGLTILEFLAYRNLSSMGMTYANIYQYLGSRDEGVGTICEDEADNIDHDNDKMRLYKSGYVKGKVVPKTDTSYGRTSIQI